MNFPEDNGSPNEAEDRMTHQSKQNSKELSHLVTLERVNKIFEVDNNE